jgi:glycosyltransferase involved in cell wall biosynthesis
MRVRDEEQFLALAIESHLPLLDELVIVYNACTDRTPEIAEEYARRYPDKVKAIHYEPEAYSYGTDEFVTLPPESPHSLVNYYNFTLCHTTRRFAMKVDGDHVIIPGRLDPLVSIIRRPWRHPLYHLPKFRSILGFSGINIWDKDGRFFVNTKEPFTEFHGVFPVSAKTWFKHDPRWEYLECRHLRHRQTCRFSFYHLKFVKKGRDQTMQDALKLPHIGLYTKELSERTVPDLIPFEEFCQRHPEAGRLPAPGELGVVAPDREAIGTL